MKYYAVTEDPNELFHYGRLGMKWGQHIFGDKPKSPGYKRALGKLRASKASGSTKKVSVPKVDKSTLRAERKVQREQEKYRKAVQKTQRNMEIVQNLHDIDNARQYERGIDKEYWKQVREARIADRQQRKYDRAERKMDKIMQQARQGKLKYGQLSDDQVQRVTQRLAMEKNARQLGSAEKTWRQQKKEAFRQGKLQGITRGTAAAMEEVARASTVYGIQNFMNRKKLNAAAKQQGKEEKIKNRERNKRTHKEVREDLREEMYEQAVASGQNKWQRRNRLTVAGAAKNLQNIENKRLEDDRKRKLQARINDEVDLAKNEDYQKMLSDQHERKRLQDISDRRATDTEERWQKYLDAEGITDAEAIKRAGYAKDSARTKEEANAQRRAIMDKAEREEKDQAYKNVAADIQRRFENEAKEAKNEKLEEKFINDMKQYEKDMQYNKAQEEKYEAQMEKYKKDLDTYSEEMRIWNSNPQVRATKKKPDEPQMPKQPTYKTTPKPDRNDRKAYPFEEIDYSPAAIPTRSEYERLRNMGINVPMFNGGGNKNGGRKKNK